jgi:hypothetical protein
MTLEKLLIFGFALAVMIALTVTATTMSRDRQPDYDGYRQKVEDTMQKMK